MTYIPQPWIGYQPDQGPQHLSHLLLALSWPQSADHFLEAFRTTHALADRLRIGIGMGLTGHSELIVFPNFGLFKIITPFHKSSLLTISVDLPTLIPLIGNNGCGPDSPEACYDNVLEIARLAQEHNRPFHFCYAGLTSLVIFPSLEWTLLPIETPTYKLMAQEGNAYIRYLQPIAHAFSSSRQ